LRRKEGSFSNISSVLFLVEVFLKTVSENNNCNTANYISTDGCMEKIRGGKDNKKSGICFIKKCVYVEDVRGLSHKKGQQILVMQSRIMIVIVAWK
jgi:hypothetical protein